MAASRSIVTGILPIADCLRSVYGFEISDQEDLVSLGDPRSEIRWVISFQIRAAPLRVTAEYATISLPTKTADARLILALN